jgi:hypothetical protein
MNYQSGLSPPMQVKATPYAHQIAAYEFALQQSATALLMEMGCGKTISSVQRMV